MGWPKVTRPEMDLSKHPHYLGTLERLRVREEFLASRRAPQESGRALEEAAFV